MVEVIRDLANEGKTAPEIAQAIGSTKGSVRFKCFQLKIKLRRQPRRRAVRPQPQPMPRQKLDLYLRPSVYAAFEREAYNMKKSPVELAELLLQAIVSSDIYEAVLNEGEK